MQNQYTVQNLLQAIDIVYNSKVGNQGNKETYQQAEKYLIKFEKCKEAWPITIEILNQDNHSEMTYFSCAKALKTKFQFDFQQLEPNDQVIIFDQLKLILQKYQRNQSRSIRIQLVLCFVFFYFHRQDLVQPNFLQFTTQFDLMFCLVILENLPDEIYNEDIVIDDEKKTNIQTHFLNYVPIVLEWLDSTLSSEEVISSEKALYQIMKVFINWVELLEDVDDKMSQVLINNKVLGVAFKSLQNSALQNKAADSIVAMLKQLKDPRKQPQLFLMTAQNVFSYFPRCQQAVKDNLEEEVLEYLKIFVRFGRVAMEDFIHNTTNEAVQFFQHMLDLSKVSSIDNSEEINEFWTKLCTKLIKIQDPNVKAEKIKLFQQLLQNILQLCAERTVLDKNHFKLFENEENEDDREEYEIKNRERINMKDLSIFITRLLGLNPVLVFLAQIINTTIQPIINVPDGDCYNSWRQLEAPLYLISHLLAANTNEDGSKKQLNQEEISTIKQITQLLMQLNLNYIRIRQTAISIIIFSIEYFQDDKQLISSVFKFIVINLGNKHTSYMASNCFQSLCSTNQAFVRENFQDFLLIFKEQFDNNYVLEGLIIAISNDQSFLEQYFNPICEIYCKILADLLMKQQNKTGEEGEDFTRQMGDQLDKLTLIVRSIPQKEEGFPHQLVISLFKQVWPVLQYIMQQHSHNERLIEKVCRHTKHTMRCLNRDFSQFLAEVLRHMVVSFQNTQKPISSYLYIVEIAVTVFFKYVIYQIKFLNKIFKHYKIIYIEYFTYEQESQILKQIYEQITQLSIQRIPNLDTFENEPELVEDFFGMQARILKYSPQFFLTSQSLQNVLQITNIGIGVRHKEAAKSLYTFMEWLYEFFIDGLEVRIPNQCQDINIKQSFNSLNIFLQGQISAEFTKKLMQALVEVPTTTVREYIYDVFLIQIKAYPQQSKIWLQNSFQVLGDDILTVGEKNKIISLVDQQKEDDDQLIDMFVLLGRRCKQSILREQD